MYLREVAATLLSSSQIGSIDNFLKSEPEIARNLEALFDAMSFVSELAQVSVVAEISLLCEMGTQLVELERRHVPEHPQVHDASDLRERHRHRR